MRLVIKFSKNSSPVDINNQHLVNNYIYQKCLKEDSSFHDAKNDYCISHLYGGKLNFSSGKLEFENGGFITATSENQDFLNKLVQGVLKNPNLFNGMQFKNFDFISENFVDGWNYFATLSPFILKTYESKEKYKFVVFQDEKFLAKASQNTKNKLHVLPHNQFSQFVENHLKNKLTKLYPNINLTNFQIQIKNHPSHKIKTIFKEFDHIQKKCVENFANQCHVNIFCDKKTAEKIYNLGLGQSTGCGFGTIYKTENHNSYKLESKK